MSSESESKSVLSQLANKAVEAGLVPGSDSRQIATKADPITWDQWAEEVATRLGEDGLFIRRALREAPLVGMSAQGYMNHLVWLGSVAMLRHSRPRFQADGYGFRDIAFKSMVIENEAGHSAEFVGMVHRLGKQIAPHMVSGVPNGGIQSFYNYFTTRDRAPRGYYRHEEDVESIDDLLAIDTSEITPMLYREHRLVTPIFYDSLDTLLGHVSAHGILSAMRLAIKTGRMEVMNNHGATSLHELLIPTILNADVRNIIDRIERRGDMSASFARNVILSYSLTPTYPASRVKAGAINRNLTRDVQSMCETLINQPSQVVDIISNTDSAQLAAAAIGVAFWRMIEEERNATAGHNSMFKPLSVIESDFAVAELIIEWGKISSRIYEQLQASTFNARFTADMLLTIASEGSIMIHNELEAAMHRSLEEMMRANDLICIERVNEHDRYRLNLEEVGIPASTRNFHLKRWGFK